MTFVSLSFIPFLAAYLLVSAVLNQRQWLWFAAAASSFFYAWWDWRFLALLYAIVTVAWFCGRKIGETDNETIRKRYVTLSVVASLLLLGIFKYFNFFIDSFGAMLAAAGLALPTHILRIALPIGISFYTFHALSYTIDLYRRKLAAPADYLSLTVYLAFFPQLVAGPIVRAHRFLPQIARGPVFQPRKIQLGIALIAWGYFLKLAVADTIATFVDRIFLDHVGYTSADLFVSMFAYSFQIYGDFAGYSLIAIGIAKLQGFDFPANFLAPYFSRSFAEFWRRWHISLSSFLRDYLYIPLGGNRHGKVKEYRNLIVTMLLGGLWHGASYNFVLWGGLHGIYLAIERVIGPFSARKKRSAAPALAMSATRMALVYLLVCFAWLFFRIPTIDHTISFIAQMLSFDSAYLHFKFRVVKAFALIVLVVVVDALLIDRRRAVRFLRRPLLVGAAIGLMIGLIELFGTFGGSAFIYFQF